MGTASDYVGDPVGCDTADRKHGGVSRLHDVRQALEPGRRAVPLLRRCLKHGPEDDEVCPGLSGGSGFFGAVSRNSNDASRTEQPASILDRERACRQVNAVGSDGTNVVRASLPIGAQTVASKRSNGGACSTSSGTYTMASTSVVGPVPGGRPLPFTIVP